MTTLLDPSHTMRMAPNRRFPYASVAMGRNSVNVPINGRVLGLWVPAQCFRRGTIIRMSAQTDTTGASLQVTIGGDGKNSGIGAFVWGHTGPGGTSVHFNAEMVQVSDGFMTRWSGGSVEAANSTGTVTTGPGVTSFNVPIQPMNFVELLNSGGTTINMYSATLEVISGSDVQASHHMLIGS